MNVLILIPVDPREAQDRRANEDRGDQRQEDNPAHALLATGGLLTHHASRFTHHSSGESKAPDIRVGCGTGSTGCALAS